ncbi:MAG: PhzF family phenazine biosynthesis protein [candidate division Zixibacteria bacterium]
MAQEIIQVDAFSARPFAGNPAAVCIMDRPAELAWMQSVAAEMNLSETAFLYPVDDGYNLRWFTPTVEVELCGHATLASAHVLFSDNHCARDKKIAFETKSGTLYACSDGDWITLDFPSRLSQPADPPEGLIKAIGAEPVAVLSAKPDYLIELDSETTVRDLSPDHSALKATGVRGLIVTARGDGEYDFVSRFFAPGAGIEEDPVTGSAHCILGPYWAKKLNKKKFTAFQASKRGGVVKVLVKDDRCELSGQAVITLRGELV